MTNSRLRVTTGELASGNDRFDRFRLIGWWDQERLARANVLVIGAGALGNEIVKNMALLGVGNIFIADLDRVENSNLSRSVLYRESDNGKPKAEIAAAAARSIYPQIKVHAFHGDVVHDLGLGVFRWADIVLGGLDNREARLSINRSCWKVNRPWVDGAIEQIQGCARFFVPDGPCYECTMSDLDWQILQNRRSCNLLTKHEMEDGRTPTTPTISSIIAGVQCQEAVKFLHGLPTLGGRGWMFEGISGASYEIEYQRKEECYSHDILDNVISLDTQANALTLGDLVQTAHDVVGHDAVIELAREMIEKFVCPKCGDEEFVFASTSKIPASKSFCPACNDVRREVVTFYRISHDFPFMERTLAEIGVPPYDIVLASNNERYVGFELAGDAPTVLGCLVGHEGEIEWE